MDAKPEEPAITVGLMTTRVIHFAMEQSGMPIILFEVRNGGASRLERAHLRVQLVPDLGDAISVELPPLDPGHVLPLNPIDYRLPPGKLRSLVESERAQWTWSLHAEGAVLARGTREVLVTAFNHWPGSRYPDGLLACFVTPNHPVVTQVLQRVRDRLRVATGDASLDGYQARSPERVRAMVAALYETIQTLGITYAEVPAGFDEGQKIRLPDAVLAEQMGCCLDISVLVAACAEQAGLRPLLVLIDGHAFPAVWLAEDRFPEGTVEDAARLRNQIALGQIVAFDSSTAVLTPRKPFAEAVAAAQTYLADDERFACALDVAVARTQGYRPLPLRAAVTEPPAEVTTAATAPERVVTRQILAEAARLPPPVERARPEPPPLPVAARFRKWQEKLLDLTLRNKLLNFRPDGRGAIPLVVGDLAAFEDLLAADGELEISPLPERAASDLRDPRLVDARLGGAELQQQRARDLASGIVRTACSPADLTSRFKNLDRSARLSLEEGGANTLFVTIGLLRWQEAEGDEDRFAPLLLYPASLTNDRQRGRIKLRRLGEDPLVNVTLLEKLRRDFSVELAALTLLEADDHGVNVPAMLQVVRAAIQARPGWEVLEQAHVGFFTFTKFLMWKDLEENARRFADHDVVRHIAEKDSRFAPAGREVAPAELDASIPATQLPCVVDADSTQMAAVASAMTGRSFVLQGPPGTGKSQTITNLIAASLASGKTVLFVSEKMAALDVVHRRLVGVGLGDFCLELHSHKSNKKDVLESFRRAFERGVTTTPPAWEARSGELQGLRTGLNAYAEALHRPREIGTTLFGAMNRLLALGAEPELRFSLGGVDRWSAAQLAGATAAVAELATRAEAVEPVARHPWRLADPPPWTARLDEEVRDALGDVVAALDDVEREAASVTRALGLHEPLATAALDLVARVLELTRASRIPAAAFQPEWPDLARRATAYLDGRKQDAARRTALLVRWTPDLLALELTPLKARFERWAHAFFLLAWWFLRGARKALAPVAREGLPPSKTIAADLREAQASREAAPGLEAETGALASAFGPAWASGDAELARVVAAGERVHELARQLPPAVAQALRLATSPPDAAALAEALGRLADAEARLARAAGAGPPAIWPPPDAPGHRADLRALAEGWSTSIARFRDWSQYRAAVRQVEELGCKPLPAAHAAGVLPARSLAGAFARKLWSQFIVAIRDQEPALRAFDGGERERAIERFGVVDRDHLELSRAWVIALLEGKLPTVGAAAAESSEPGLLGRELRKKARHLPIRKLLSAIPVLLPRLKPCLLMSPLSIAQYLPADGRGFDLVVFDEASQIGTHDAIGAIARGKQVVVVGDSKQLPPTSFFTRRGDDEDAIVDENDQEELESVLEEALAKGLPQQMLGWHYRSRHDSLIDFSNEHFYGGKLHVFPAAARFVEGLGVRWHPVPDGVYQSGSASERPRTNPVEARALVAQLVASLRGCAPGSRTFGVVTFGMTQQELILDLLETERQRFPEIEPHFAGDEAVFVKNLENVQGDERDEILFSIGYARDEHGKLRMHFGPLSLAGGERRLNVAITRARCQLRVFSTLTHDQIDLARTGAHGARLLRQFLEFASRHAANGAASVAAPSAHPDATVVADVRRAIEALGHQLHERVGCGGYRIDLGVLSPDRPGVYALGVETDGPAYASARTARDRDRLRRQVLTALGWRMHRVWTPDWLRDRAGEVQRLSRAIDAAIAQARVAPVPAASPALEPPRGPAPPPVVPVPGVPAPPARDPTGSDPPLRAVAPAAPALRTAASGPPARPYQLARLEVVSDDPASLYGPTADRQILERVAATIQIESPVHVDELARRVLACFGAQRLTAKPRRRIEEALETLARSHAVSVEDSFVWTPSSRAGLTGFRGPAADGTTRDLGCVPPEEIANAAAWVLAQNLSLDRADLARETARLFGISRLGKNVVAALDGAIALLVRRGQCVADGDRLTQGRGGAPAP